MGGNYKTEPEANLALVDPNPPAASIKPGSIYLDIIQVEWHVLELDLFIELAILLFCSNTCQDNQRLSDRFTECGRDGYCHNGLFGTFSSGHGVPGQR